MTNEVNKTVSIAVEPLGDNKFSVTTLTDSKWPDLAIMLEKKLTGYINEKLKDQESSFLLLDNKTALTSPDEPDFEDGTHYYLRTKEIAAIDPTGDDIKVIYKNGQTQNIRTTQTTDMDVMKRWQLTPSQQKFEKSSLGKFFNGHFSRYGRTPETEAESTNYGRKRDVAADIYQAAKKHTALLRITGTNDLYINPELIAYVGIIPNSPKNIKISYFVPNTGKQHEVKIEHPTEGAASGCCAFIMNNFENRSLYLAKPGFTPS